MSDIGGIWGILKETYKYYIFWKNMKGKQIVLINHSFNSNTGDNLINHYFEIEGTIEDVMLLPMGFKLKNVTERYRTGTYELLFQTGVSGPVDINKCRIGSFVLREIDEKIVSFAAIHNMNLKKSMMLLKKKLEFSNFFKKNYTQKPVGKSSLGTDGISQ